MPFKILLFKYKCFCLQNIYKFRLVPYILKHNSYLVAMVNKNSNNYKKALPHIPLQSPTGGIWVPLAHTLETSDS